MPRLVVVVQVAVVDWSWSRFGVALYVRACGCVWVCVGVWVSLCSVLSLALYLSLSTLTGSRRASQARPIRAGPIRARAGRQDRAGPRTGQGSRCRALSSLFQWLVGVGGCVPQCRPRSSHSHAAATDGRPGEVQGGTLNWTVLDWTWFGLGLDLDLDWLDLDWTGANQTKPDWTGLS